MLMVFVFSLQKVFSDVFEKTLGYIQELTNEDMKQKVLFSTVYDIGSYTPVCL